MFNYKKTRAVGLHPLPSSCLKRLLLQEKADQRHRQDAGDDREGKTFAGQCDKDCRYRCCEVERRQRGIIIALSKQQVLKKQSTEQANRDERQPLGQQTGQRQSMHQQKRQNPWNQCDKTTGGE